MKHLFCTLVLLLSLPLYGQRPSWTRDMVRGSEFPPDRYLTGFVTNLGSNTPAFAADIKAGAKAQLIEGILISVKSARSLSKSERNGIVQEDYTASTRSFADADISGMRQEYFYDADTRTGYAFAYALRSDVIRYYQAVVQKMTQEIDAQIDNATHFEKQGNKIRARKIYADLTVSPLFAELDVTQSILTALEPGAGDQNLSARYLQTISQTLSRLEGTTVVFISSSEESFGKKVSLLAPKLKSLLAENGCSFTTDRGRADWILTISSSTREGSQNDGIYFSFLDAESDL